MNRTSGKSVLCKCGRSGGEGDGGYSRVVVVVVVVFVVGGSTTVVVTDGRSRRVIGRDDCSCARLKHINEHLRRYVHRYGSRRP